MGEGGDQLQIPVGDSNISDSFDLLYRLVASWALLQEDKAGRERALALIRSLYEQLC